MTEEILIAAKEGDEDAIAQILEVTRPICVGLIRKFKTHPSDFEDVVQDAVITILGCIGKYNRKHGVFERFACSAVYNSLLTRYQEQKKKKMQSLNGFEPRIWDGREQVEALDMLEHLDRDHRMLVQEHYGIAGSPEYSLKQLAIRHGYDGEWVVKQQLSEAFEELRERIQ